MSNLGLYNCYVTVDTYQDTALIVLARSPEHADKKVRDYLVYKLFRSSIWSGNCIVDVHKMNNDLLQRGVYKV